MISATISVNGNIEPFVAVAEAAKSLEAETEKALSATAVSVSLGASTACQTKPVKPLPELVNGKVTFFKKALVPLTTVVFDKDISLDIKVSELIKSLLCATWKAQQSYPSIFAEVVNSAHDIFKSILDCEQLWKDLKWAGGITEAVLHSNLVEDKKAFDERLNEMRLEGAIHDTVVCTSRWCC